MKKLAIAALLVLVGCRGHSRGTGPVTAGGALSPREAIEAFLEAAKDQNYEKMSLIFGSSQGPARATIPKSELEQREFIMMRCLRHDRVQVGSETPTPTGEKVMTVQLWYKDLTSTSDFTAALGPNKRWYVKQLDMDPLQKACASL